MPRGIDESGHSRNAASGHAPRSPARSASEPDESQGSDAVEDKALKLKGCSRAAVEGIPSTTERAVGPDILARLTSKEREVVEALSAGTTVPLIARASGRSPRTLRNQLRSVYRKLGIHSQVELLSRLRHN